MAKPKIIIEHLESKPSKWLLIEYKHASRLVGKDNILFSNVKDPSLYRFLLDYGIVYRESVIELEDKLKNIIVLDPKADLELKPQEIDDNTFIVIGGILGDHPPRGRTWELLTSKLKRAKPRNIGKHQFSIDGAVYMALKVAEGLRINDIPIIVGYKIKMKVSPGIEHEIELPYAYPLVDGKPLISNELIRYLKGGIVFNELKEICL